MNFSNQRDQRLVCCQCRQSSQVRHQWICARSSQVGPSSWISVTLILVYVIVNVRQFLQCCSMDLFVQPWKQIVFFKSCVNTDSKCFSIICVYFFLNKLVLIYFWWELTLCSSTQFLLIKICDFTVGTNSFQIWGHYFCVFNFWAPKFHLTIRLHDGDIIHIFEFISGTHLYWF